MENEDSSQPPNVKIAHRQAIWKLNYSVHAQQRISKSQKYLQILVYTNIFNYSAIIFTTSSAYHKQAEGSALLQLLQRGLKVTFRKTTLSLGRLICLDFLYSQENERNFSKEAVLGSCRESPSRRAPLLLGQEGAEEAQLDQPPKTFVHPPSPTACLLFFLVSMVDMDVSTSYGSPAEDALLPLIPTVQNSQPQSFWNTGCLAPFLLVPQYRHSKIIIESPSGSYHLLFFHTHQTKNQKEARTGGFCFVHHLQDQSPSSAESSDLGKYTSLKTNLLL